MGTSAVSLGFAIIILWLVAVTAILVLAVRRVDSLARRLATHVCIDPDPITPVRARHSATRPSVTVAELTQREATPQRYYPAPAIRDDLDRTQQLPALRQRRPQPPGRIDEPRPAPHRPPQPDAGHG